MAEFKVTSNVDAQIAALKKAGGKLNEGFSATSDSGVSTLSTAKAAIAEQKQIRKLLEFYAQLIEKDAADLTAMVETARKADQAVSGRVSG